MAFHAHDGPELPEAAKQHIQVDYANEARLENGEVFRRALEAENGSKPSDAALWEARLSERMYRNLQKLKTIDGSRLFTAMKPLIPLVALWYDFLPGALNRVLPMRCREV